MSWGLLLSRGMYNLVVVIYMQTYFIFTYRYLTSVKDVNLVVYK